MFEDSTFESTGRIKTRSKRWMIAALGLNGSVLAAMILFPLVYPEALHRNGSPILMEAPRPPAEQPRPLPKPEHAVIVQAHAPADLFAPPIGIPKFIDTPANPEVLQQMNVADLGATPGGNGIGPDNPFTNHRPGPVVQQEKKGPIRISATELSAPIYRTLPVYSPIAKASGTQGTVVLQATISKVGTIENLRVVSGSPMLQQAALDAVKQWRYRPYRLDGEAVEVETTINVVFTLGR